MKYGLGIDAGGTYTDSVIFDFEENKVVSKAKALTTRWKFSEGIMEAVNKLPSDELRKVELTAVSTTLVTNAIVEGESHPVGLFIMPSGNEVPENILHNPVKVIKGRMTILGEITEQTESSEIIEAAKKMIREEGVEAFAVSGYGGARNPELELKVKKILREHTSLDVCCGHELSGALDFSVRAQTAVLNAGVIPVMESFLKEMEISIGKTGINAPLIVVRGDGSVMKEEYAREYPIQSALSGPAASLSGAAFLSGTENALVVDVGGTTSDIGFLSKGKVSVKEDGAVIGGMRTHVKAVDMYTAGIGGDSEIIRSENGLLDVGPKRITPLCRLAESFDLKKEIKKFKTVFFSKNISDLKAYQFYYFTGREPDFSLNPVEKKILSLLKEAPVPLYELVEKSGSALLSRPGTGRLEKSACIQRSGLTPTDIFTITGRIKLWDSQISGLYMDFVSLTAGMQKEQLINEILEIINVKLAKSMLNKLFPDYTASIDVSDKTGFFDILLHGGNNNIKLVPELKIPVLGLGAAAELMLEKAVERIGGNLIIPENGDVANAVGAVTNNVSVTLEALIKNTGEDEYIILGLENKKNGYRYYKSLEEAMSACTDIITGEILKKAVSAGTSEKKVIIEYSDSETVSSGGNRVFLQRTVTASVSGKPDLL